jgi:hypothetical protein
MTVIIDGTTGITTPGETNTGNLSVTGTTTLTTVLPVTSGGTGASSLSGITVGTATSATTATNLASGSAGVIPYQSGSGATSFTSAGTSGQVLTSAGTGTPTWTTPSAGAMSLISLTNISSGNTSVSVSIPSTYNGVYFVISAVADTSATYGRVLVRFNNNSSSIYNGAQVQGTSTSAYTNDVGITLQVGNSGATAQASIGVGTVFSLQSSALKNMVFQTSEANPGSGGYNALTYGGGNFNSTSTISSIQFVNTSGSWASGQIFVYGIT